MEYKSYNKTREKLVAMYLDALKKDQLPWKQGWINMRNQNPTSKTVYRGVNALMCMCAANEYGYHDPRWTTFKQIEFNGWHLQKGAKGVPIELWKIRHIESGKTIDYDTYNYIVRDVPEKAAEFKWMVRNYYVFNYECIDGVPELKNKQFKDIDALNEICERIDKNIDLTVKHDDIKAYYSPSEDTVHLPDKNLFDGVYDYYATRLHEVAHATGNEKRLNRNISNAFGSEEYAKEELIAEISSSFLMADLGINGNKDIYDNHAAYIQSWINVIEKEPSVLFEAAANAEKCANYILDNSDYEEIIKKYEANASDVDMAYIFENDMSMTI